MTTTRQVPTTPAETLTGFGADLAALEQQLDEKEKKENQALQDFKYLHNRLTGAANPSKWALERGTLLAQARAIGNQYFAGGDLRANVPSDLTTLSVLNVYKDYAESWRAIPVQTRPMGTPDYAARAVSINTFLEKHNFGAQCKAAASAEVTAERRLSH